VRRGSVGIGIVRSARALRRRRMRIGIFRRPGDVRQIGNREKGAYFSHANPGLCDIDEQAILCPFPRPLGFLYSKIGAVLLQVDLNYQSDAVPQIST
jgi:hypothetical protein